MKSSFNKLQYMKMLTFRQYGLYYTLVVVFIMISMIGKMGHGGVHSSGRVVAIFIYWGIDVIR